MDTDEIAGGYMNELSQGKPILIVEDEPKLAQLLADYLGHAGFQSECLDNGLRVIPWVKNSTPALILLDLMLPGMDGIDICRELRRFSDVPVIMVTARVEEVDRLLGLELGADDYICKPFSPREVVARVKTVLRRVRPRESTAKSNDPSLKLHEDSLRLSFAERSVQLTLVEFQLLETMFNSPGRVFSRSQLIDRIYDDHRVVSDRTVDSHIKKLRRKLEALAPDRSLIHAVYGAGYRYEEER